MSNYRRFITYLFQYENGEKQRQCGHARIEQRQNQGKIDFYIKDCGADMGELMPYFFAQQGQVRLPIGKLNVKNNSAEGAFRFECTRMGDTRHHFSEMQGLVIPLGNNRMIISQWEEEAFSWSALQGQEQNNKSEPDNVAQNHVEQNTLLNAAEIPQDTSVVQQQTTSLAQALELQLRALRPKHYPFQGNLEDWATQAQLRDIKLLPRDYWKLANNSFVLRGYFNYGSILIGYMESEKRFFIGIPGIFQKQERVIAGLFGFNRFRGQRSAEGKPGDFGYWYQLLDVV